MIGDILADSILIVVPLKLLWRLDQNNCPQRRRLLVVFSSSIVTTTTSLVHAYYLLRVGGIYSLLAGDIEVRRTVFLHVHSRFVLTDGVSYLDLLLALRVQPCHYRISRLPHFPL